MRTSRSMELLMDPTLGCKEIRLSDNCLVLLVIQFIQLHGQAHNNPIMISTTDASTWLMITWSRVPHSGDESFWVVAVAATVSIGRSPSELCASCVPSLMTDTKFMIWCSASRRWKIWLLLVKRFETQA